MDILIQDRRKFTLMPDNQLPLDGALARQNAAQKPLVLIVETHEPSRDLMKTILLMKGCEVVEADLPEVIAVAEKFQPRLVMLDIGRPFEEGLETIKQMQTCPTLDGVPIIITSGNGTSAFREEVTTAGYDEFLVKPIDFDRLDWLLEQHLFTQNSETPSH